MPCDAPPVPGGVSAAWHCHVHDIPNGYPEAVTSVLLKSHDVWLSVVIISLHATGVTASPPVHRPILTPWRQRAPT
ncbi:hypothetical protein FRACA_1380014 [Frankia canadensis]|uniref:Uncharacterized protein n=1 Tax=Frankia canadensis TaxID=1836972 RepID=A0A2I2KL30_9ACTN|nr:hypothetical protein FRACA_1380014 [Frankia canadensis]SOU53669.1 hypothetical protein FRACA_1380014 [Frankia canadensis]